MLSGGRKMQASMIESSGKACQGNGKKARTTIAREQALG